MITVRPESDYDCVYIELADPTSRVQMHVHVRPGTRDLSRRELRQIEVSSTADTVFAMDNVTDKLPCDPHGLGGSNVYSGYDYENCQPSELDKEREVEKEASDVDDG
ncbi:MAG: hypothetical protein V3T23_11250 [Nitrososphaerales archaeon]